MYKLKGKVKECAKLYNDNASSEESFEERQSERVKKRKTLEDGSMILSEDHMQKTLQLIGNRNRPL